MSDGLRFPCELMEKEVLQQTVISKLGSTAPCRPINEFLLLETRRRDGGAPRQPFPGLLPVARREFKRDLALVVHDEIRRERFSSLGNELVEQIRLARSE